MATATTQRTGDLTPPNAAAAPAIAENAGIPRGRRTATAIWERTGDLTFST